MALPASPLGWDLWFTPSTYSPRHMCPSDHIPLKSLPQRQRVRTNSLPRLNLAVLPLSTPPEVVTQNSDSLSLMAPVGRAEGFVVLRTHRRLAAPADARPFDQYQMNDECTFPSTTRAISME